jgi:hypothetical protein
MGPMFVTSGTVPGEIDGTIASSRGLSNFRLTLKGNHVSGRLTLADGTLYRLAEVDKR